jgi:hypothetical protein
VCRGRRPTRKAKSARRSVSASPIPAPLTVSPRAEAVTSR